jgi:RNA-splicing ligase RtcB
MRVSETEEAKASRKDAKTCLPDRQAQRIAELFAAILMSRTSAKNSITKKMVREELDKHKVDLIGGGLDEAPMAYKDITKVMYHQRELVNIVGAFTPKIVRMCGNDSPAED